MIVGLVKNEMPLLNGMHHVVSHWEKLITGAASEENKQFMISPGEYELCRVENPWYPRKDNDHYPGDWFVIKGTMTGINEVVWRKSNWLEIIRDDE